MGITNVTLEIGNLTDPSKKIKGEFLVDSGAHYTVLPQSYVKKLGLKPSFNQKFSLADGKIIERPIGSALIKFEDKEGAVMVVLGKKEDNALLGVTTLEAFGLMIDPFKRQIYHSKLMLGKITT